MPTPEALSETAIELSLASALLTSVGARYTRRTYLENTPGLAITAEARRQQTYEERVRGSRPVSFLDVKIANRRNGAIEIDGFEVRLSVYHSLPTHGFSLRNEYFADTTQYFPFLMPGRATRRWRYNLTDHFTHWDGSTSRTIPGLLFKFRYWLARSDLLAHAHLTVVLPTGNVISRIQNVGNSLPALSELVDEEQARWSERFRHRGSAWEQPELPFGD